MLAINHISTRHPPSLMRDEARAVFANTVVPRDFDTIEIPFAERGEPSLTRWDAQAAAAGQPTGTSPAQLPSPSAPTGQPTCQATGA